MKPLSLAQLRVLGCLSRKAYKRLADTGATAEAYEDWRHDFTAQVCGGIESWRALDQRHYVPLCNAYRSLLGKAPMADHTPVDDAAALIWTIRDRAAHWELPRAYVAAIVADMAARPWVKATMSLEQMLAGVDTSTLRHILYTLQARGRSRVQKDCDQLGLAPPRETHTSRSTMPPPRLAAWRGDIMARPAHSSDTRGS